MSQNLVPVMIAVAPNGARKTRHDHPRLPITPAELAQCAADCVAAGASMLHLHVRDATGRHSLDPADYRPAIEAIRARVGDELLLQLTTESGGRYTPSEQMASTDALAPEALSVAIRELFADAALHGEVAAFLARLAARGALVQYIVYSADDVARCVRLQAEGAIPQGAPQLLFVLGSYAEGRAGRPADLLPMLAALPAGWPWSACAFGAAELRCVVAAALLGGHVRVGFENNLQLPSGAVAADNAALIGVTRNALHALGMRQSTFAETRRFLRGA
jgi:3-keto-5-aminohexanoate cleavage enzyme